MKRIGTLWILLGVLLAAFALEIIYALNPDGATPKASPAPSPTAAAPTETPVPSETPAPTETPAPAAKPAKIYEDVVVPPGEYLVGEDIPAGVYACYCAAPEKVCTLYVYNSAEAVFPDASYFLIYSRRLEEIWGVIDSGAEKVILEEGSRVVIEGDEASFSTWIEGD